MKLRIEINQPLTHHEKSLLLEAIRTRIEGFGIDWEDVDCEIVTEEDNQGLTAIEARDRDLRINQQEASGNSIVRRLLNL